MTPQQCQNMLKHENKKFGKTMKLVGTDPDAKPGMPLQVWRSKNFLARVVVLVEELRAFARLRTRRESQWERLFGYMNGDYGFSFYGETRLETLTYYAEFRRQQKRDGLLRRFPGAGRSFDRALQQLGRIGALK